MIYEKAMELVTALRSGKYLQGNGRLKKDKYHFCCLGVACQISGVAKFKREDDSYDFYFYDGVWADLPESVMNYFGFYSQRANRRDNKFIMIDGKNYYSLSRANDSDVPFSKIADYIEENWESL